MTKNEHLLIQLAEECAEVVEMVSKSLRFGLDDSHPLTFEENKERLILELTDVFTMVDLCIEAGVLPDFLSSQDELSAAKKRKRERVIKYLDYAKQRGTLS